MTGGAKTQCCTFHQLHGFHEYGPPYWVNVWGVTLGGISPGTTFITLPAGGFTIGHYPLILFYIFP